MGVIVMSRVQPDRLALTSSAESGGHELPGFTVAGGSVKAAPQDQWKLLDLAETDRLIARRRHDRKVLPQLDELRKLAGSRQSLAELWG